MKPSYDVEQFKRVFEKEYTYLNGFMRNVRRRGDSPALHCPLSGRTWTYRTLNEDANRLANALRKHGYGYGDVMFYILPNSPEFLFCYLAAHKTGMVGAPGNYRLSGGEISLLINDLRPKVLVYDAEFAKIVGDALKLASYQPEIVIFCDAENKAEAPLDQKTFREFVEGMPSADPELSRVPSIYDETTRFFTSGTTNLPKGVPCNSLNEVLSAHDVMMHFPLTATDVTMNLTPWFHRGGLHSGGPCPCLYAGASMVALRDFSPKLALQYIAKYRITFIIGAPTIAEVLSRLSESVHADFSSLRGMVLMGSPLDNEPCHRYMKGITPIIFNGYGTTETFWNTFLRPYDLPEKAGSAGGSCTDDEVRVIRIETTGHASPKEMVVQDNETVGEVVILSPAKSTSTYANNEEMTRAKFHDGWLYTGDLATWDEHGYLTIVGRKDDMIVSAGENIYPVQVEAILNENPKVAESLVLGIPDPKRGAVVVAVIKPADPSLTEKEMKQWCLSHPMLAPYKRPRKFRFVDELPHSGTGKLLHRMPEGVSFDD